MRIVSAALALAFVATACGSSSPSARASGTTLGTTASSAPVTSTTTRGRPPCPNPDDAMGTERCLGTVAAGTYTTAMFAPPLTYTVPDGWQNLEDMQGNFLLLPPRSKLEGVDNGTTDFIGVYTSVRAPRDCVGNDYDPAAPATVAGYMHWLHQQSGVVLSNERLATVGGLAGTVVDITLGDHPTCRDDTSSYSMVLVGTNPSTVSHAAAPDLTIRLYVLQSGPFLLAVEVDDTTADQNIPNFLPAADAIIKTFKMKTT